MKNDLFPSFENNVDKIMLKKLIMNFKELYILDSETTFNLIFGLKFADFLVSFFIRADNSSFCFRGVYPRAVKLLSASRSDMCLLMNKYKFVLCFSSYNNIDLTKSIQIFSNKCLLSNLISVASTFQHESCQFGRVTFLHFLPFFRLMTHSLQLRLLNTVYACEKLLMRPFHVGLQHRCPCG